MDAPEALVAAARAGDAEALDALLEAIWPDLFRIAYGITRNRAIAEDAAQEASVSILRSIGTLLRTDLFHPWAIRIICRAARLAARKESRTAYTLGQQQAALDVSLGRLEVQRALSSLTVLEREVITLRFFAELTTKEIAQALRIPDGTVRARLWLARRRLRKLLDDARSLETLSERTQHESA